MITDVLPGVQITINILLFVADAGPTYALRRQSMSHILPQEPRPTDSQAPFTSAYLLLYSKGDKLPKHFANRGLFSEVTPTNCVGGGGL